MESITNVVEGTVNITDKVVNSITSALTLSDSATDSPINKSNILILDNNLRKQEKITVNKDTIIVLVHYNKQFGDFMIDTHSHLFEDEFKDDLDLCIERCKENNVNKILIVGFSDETNLKAQELANKYDIFYPTAGVHPEEAGPDYLEKFNRLVEFIKNNKVYAIGECGLDYHWDITYKEEQHKLLRLQCELALKNDLPIIIHMRDATKDTYDILKDYKGLRGVMHCYSGSYEMAKEFIKLGFYISLGGPVTFKNAKEPKLIAKEIPLDKLLIETDCPFLAPTPFRGKRNESSYVKYVCEEIANIKGVDKKVVEEETTRNAETLFKI